MKIGLLTSGGDAQGLNAAIRGVAKTLYHLRPNVEIYGIQNGYYGLIDRQWRLMDPSEFSGILTLGGTILGTSRKPNQWLEDDVRLEKMMEGYRASGFDCLVILGGDGTHKDAFALSEAGANVVTLPKTIDNDIYGTDLTFGFDSAVEKASSVIDAIHTTAAAHGRAFIIELMGNQVGWIALYAGVASGADVVLLPEIPYSVEKVYEVIEQRNRAGKNFSIIAIAEGAITTDELGKPKEEIRSLARHASTRLSRHLEKMLDQDIRVAIPGHFQRGGEPTPTDRMLCTRFGAKAAELVINGDYGNMVALRGTNVVPVPLREMVGKLKYIPQDHEILRQAKLMGLSFGI